MVGGSWGMHNGESWENLVRCSRCAPPERCIGRYLLWILGLLSDNYHLGCFYFAVGAQCEIQDQGDDERKAYEGASKHSPGSSNINLGPQPSLGFQRLGVLSFPV